MFTQNQEESEFRLIMVNGIKDEGLIRVLGFNLSMAKETLKENSLWWKWTHSKITFFKIQKIWTVMGDT